MEKDASSSPSDRKKLVVWIAIVATAAGLGSIAIFGSGFFASQSIKDEVVTVKGFVDLIVHDEFGHIKEERHYNNQIQ